jgi:dihydroorotase
VIRPGEDANIAVVDHGVRGVSRGAELRSAVQTLHPFEGRETIGRPVATVIRGRVVMQDGVVAEGPGWGRMERPEMAPPEPRNLATTTRAILKPKARPW